MRVHLTNTYSFQSIPTASACCPVLCRADRVHAISTAKALVVLIETLPIVVVAVSKRDVCLALQAFERGVDSIVMIDSLQLVM